MIKLQSVNFVGWGRKRGRLTKKLLPKIFFSLVGGLGSFHVCIMLINLCKLMISDVRLKSSRANKTLNRINILSFFSSNLKGEKNLSVAHLLKTAKVRE